MSMEESTAVTPEPDDINSIEIFWKDKGAKMLLEALGLSENELTENQKSATAARIYELLASTHISVFQTITSDPKTLFTPPALWANGSAEAAEKQMKRWGGIAEHFIGQHLKESFEE